MIILKNNLKRIFFNKSNFVFLFIIPILFSVFLLKSNSGISRAYIGVYSEDKGSGNRSLNGEISDALIRSLKDDFEIVEIDKESDIEKKLLKGNMDLCLVLKEGFDEALVKGDITKAQLIGVKESGDITVLKKIIEYMLSRYASISISSHGDKEAVLRKLRDTENGMFGKTIEDISNGKGTRRDSAAAMGLIALSIMSISFFGFIVEDKEEERFERLMITPMSIKSYHLQNLFTYFGVTVVSTLIILIYQRNSLGVNVKGAFITIFIIFILLGLVCTAECIFVSSISKNLRQFYAIQTLIYTPSGLLAGCYFPRNMMPEVLQNISNIVPATWALKATDKIVYKGANITNLWVEMIILMLLSIVFFLLASWRKRDLLK